MVTAREHVRVARALVSLPLVKAAFARGAISYSKVRAITRIANADNEEALLNIANSATAAQVDRLVRGCQRVLKDDAKKQSRARSAEYGFDADGMFYLRARLMPDEGARLMAALDAGASAEASREWGDAARMP